MLRSPVPRTLGVPPVVAGGLALGAGAALLWLQRRAQQSAMEGVRMERTFQADALYRRPNYKGMSSQQLNAASQLLNQWGRDVYQDPLTGTLIERRAIDAERMKRAGGGGFIFIPPPVAAPVISPALAWTVGGLVAGGVKLAEGLGQLWGWLASRPKTKTGAANTGGITFPGTWPPPGNTVGAEFRYRLLNGSYTSYTTSSCTTTSFVSSTGISGWAVFSSVIAVEPYTESGTCGTRIYGLEIKKANGTSVREAMIATTYGLQTYARPVEGLYLGANAGPYVPLPETLPLPDGYEPPEVQPAEVPEPRPLPPLPLPPWEEPQVPVDPEADPAPLPPDPNRPPATVPVVPGVAPRPSVVPVLPGDGAATNPDGTVQQPKPALPPVTNPDWHFPIPGAPPVTGNGPQTTPEEMAKELGRLEQKLSMILNPKPDTGIEWAKLIPQIAEALFSLTAGRSYTLTEKCSPCDGSDYVPATVTVNAPGALNALGVIGNRLDAIAELLDGQLGLKQQICPPCKPKQLGQWVSVNFVSDERSPGGKNVLRKLFRYRDLSGTPHLTHTQHWENFTWQAGPVCVISKNLEWGVPQVWAATEAEGKRVIAHAAAVSGVNLSDPRHEWIVTGSVDPRYGQPGTMRVERMRDGQIRVAKRDGPNGLPRNYRPVPSP